MGTEIRVSVLSIGLEHKRKRREAGTGLFPLLCVFEKQAEKICSVL